MTERPGFGQLARTLRHLTARQIAARFYLVARHRIYARWPAVARAGLEGPARLDPSGRSRVARWMSMKYPAPLSPTWTALASGAAERRFTFLHRTLEPIAGAADWAAPGMTPLWRYQLEYGDYVLALALGASQASEPRWAEQALALMEEWIASHPAPRRPGWDAYPLSLRVVNWTAALALLGEGVPEERRDRLARSLGAQGRYLARHIEWHLGGNHLLKNAKAMLVLGLALECPESRDWRERGWDVLRRELRRQVLPDGGHYERSPLYHGIVLEDVLDVLALSADRADLVNPREELLETARRMTGWLARMRHPDGGLALFNDGAIATEPDPEALLAYAARVAGGEAPSDGTFALPASGYYVLRRGERRAIVDCGEVGPDELPAHAHADTLSFELTWDGERLVVDSGTHEYLLDDLRRYARSTAAHNTVRVDGAEQSEMWGSHRVGRRARPLCARVSDGVDASTFTGAHDGYARLGVVHHRHIVATDHAWIVADELRGRGRHRFESNLHLHPQWRLEGSGSEWRAIRDRRVVRLRPLGDVSCERWEATYAPEWGVVLSAPALRLSGERALPITFGWALHEDGADLDFRLDSDERGVQLVLGSGGRTTRIHSDRCTSSS